GYITVDNNAGDRNNITFWHGGEALIERVTSSCSNTIVITHIVGPVLMESWIDNPSVTAVLSAGLPGQESGNALVDILFGAVNPSGRLPYTIAKQRSDYPADILYESNEGDFPQITYSEGLNVDYRHFDANNITPRFEFGFGMSYTTFAYNSLNIRSGPGNNAKRQEQPAPAAATPFPVPIVSTAATAVAPSTVAVSGPSSAASTLVSSALVISSASVIASVPASVLTSAPPIISSSGPANLYETITTVTYTIKNTGEIDGNEVSQVYLGFPASAKEPPKVLRGFDRTFIKRGKTASISVGLRRKDVSVWDVVKQEWVIPPGTFTVMVGSSSSSIHLTGTFVP
ncbi:hypothetical protein M422DRAFT_190727, partial [Sphaerobolus stellatus SS14]